MSMEITKELWNEMKRYINTVDRAEAAETVVSILIDHDIDPDDIQSAFSSDRDIKAALTSYLDNDKDYAVEDEEEEEDDSDYNEDENWEN